MSKLTFYISLCLCLGACAPKHNDYSRFESINQSGWAYGDTISFTPLDLDSVAKRQLSVAIRHSNAYEFRNLWLEVTYGDKTTAYRRDTINMNLADIYGRWNGKGIGPSYQYETVINQAIALSDSSHIHIRHIMRVDTLHGIELLGITIATPTIQK